jgi:hypothetical protein
MIRMTARDSATKFLTAQGIAATVSKVAEFLNAQKVVYVNVQRVQNLLRVEIVEKGYPQYYSSQSGVGILFACVTEKAIRLYTIRHYYMLCSVHLRLQKMTA